MNEHGKSVGSLDIQVELVKEFMFPSLLDRAWDEFEGYKVELFSMISWCPYYTPSTQTWARTSLVMKRRTSSSPRLTLQTPCLYLVSPQSRHRLQLLLAEVLIQGESI